jgi:cellulose synthase/poly-beta-1,6-N-acetylglucosamine synthase-like glycosyltransferase
MDLLKVFLYALDAIVVVYFVLYMGVNLMLLAISSRTVRRALQKREVFKQRTEDLDRDRSFAPLVSLIVPAYNEEVTIVDTVQSLLRLSYPAFEIIVVNDGSKDGTIAVMKEAFEMARSDVDYDPLLGCMPTRGFYRATTKLPSGVVRIVLVDKENGGKADAINAGINASQGAYVASMDADSLMVERALHLAMQPIVDDPNRVVACGGQIALSNDSVVEDGEVVDLRIPRSWIARFQVVEYMRSFTQSRTALGELNALLILSGVFAVFQREALVAAGGFLSKHMRSKVGREYCGVGAETVCEDMEVVVRLHRFMIEHNQQARIEFLPFPTSWTEAPEVWRDLGKQRNRWYRGLLEVLWIHRGMMFRPRYGRIGMFSLPYQFFFEALAPILEIIGYIIVPLSWLAGLLGFEVMVSFIAFALACNLVLSAGSTLLAVMRVRSAYSGKDLTLLDYRGARALLVLTLAGLLSNLGYRQYLLYWQLRGLRDFLAGRKSWDKFARKGFKKTG